MKTRNRMLSMLLALALLVGLLPTVLPTVAEAAVTDTPAGVRNHLPSTARDIVYLSDMNWETSVNNDGAVAIKNGAWSNGAAIVMGLAAHNGGTTFEKGLGVMPKGTSATDASHTVYDLADNNYAQNFFYAAAGITNGTAQGGGTTNGVVFEVWASYDKSEENYAEAEYVLLERSGDPAKGTHVKGSYVYQFHLDVTGVRYLKLVVYAVGGIGYMNSNWAGICVYNNPGYYPKGHLLGRNDGVESEVWYPSGTDRFNTYHFTSIPNDAVMLSGSTFKNTSDNKGTSKVVDFKSASGNLGNTARWLGGIADSLTATNVNQKEGIVLKNFASFLNFNARQPANSNNQADGWATFDISGLNVNRFYTAVGLSNATAKHTAYSASDGKYGGMKVQVWGCATKDGTYTLLSESEPIMLNQVGEFDVDITGYNFLKLRLQAKDTRKIDGLDMIFYKPCVFNDQWTVAASGDDSVLQGMKADYTATVTRSFAPMHNYTGDFAWEIDGAEKEGTKIENGKLIVDPAETATSVSITATATEGNRTVTSAPLSVAITSIGDNVAYVEDNGFGTLGGALAAADGETVTLVKDVALAEAVAIADVETTLNLNGKTVSGETIATLGAGADLTIVADGGELEGKLALAADGATITSDCAIDLEMNGNDATVNAKNVTLTDSATDNGTEGGKIYGDCTVTDTVITKGDVNYVVLDHGDYLTSNAVRVKVKKVSIRPSAAGIYYTTELKFNKNIVGAGATYGVVLSTTDKPGADFMTEKNGESFANLWTVGTPTEGEDFISVSNSCLVKNIFTEDAGDANVTRGETEIYANGYVKLTVGGEEIVIMAENNGQIKYSMRSIMEALDGKIMENGTLTATGEKALNFYKTWKDAMAGWTLPNLKNA